MSSLSLRLAEDQQSVEAVLNTQVDGEPINELSVKKLLAESDFCGFKLSDSGLKALLSAAQNSKNAPDDASSTSIHNIAMRLDGQLSIVLSLDQMSATATITAAYGGQPIEPSQMQQTQEEMGVIQGIDSDAISALLEQARTGESGAEFSRPIAMGKAAVKGRDGRWVSDVQTLRQQLKPQTREDGTVDLRDFGEILTVESGQQLMHREPPTPGQNGFTVTGECLVAVSGSEAEFVPAEGISLGKDPDLIVASRGGMPVETPGGMRVDNIYSIKNVDLSSGDIIFDGGVIVQGDIQEGMRVSATGDVTVGGSVYFSEVDSGGDILVRKGVVGNQRQGDDQHFNSEDLSCSLKAQGHLSLGFAQYARLEAVAGISVDKQLLHCMASTVGDIAIGKGGDRNSKLIGGVTRAGNQVCCGIFGTEAFVPTEVELCPDVKEFHDQVQIATEQLELKQRLIDDLQQILPKIKMLPKGPARQEKLAKIVNTINHTAQETVALAQKIERLEQQEAERLEAARVVSTTTIYPNVNVVIAGQRLKTRREYQGGGLCYRQREVVHDPSLK
ncbi:MAG: FapA family protein [Halopseudomonas sp.]